MYRYAQLDNNGNCVSVSQLLDAVNVPNMLELGPNDDVKPGDIYSGESWTRPDLIDPEFEPDRITQLETENLELKLALAELAEAQQTDRSTLSSHLRSWLKS